VRIYVLAVIPLSRSGRLCAFRFRIVLRDVLQPLDAHFDNLQRNPGEGARHEDGRLPLPANKRVVGSVICSGVQVEHRHERLANPEIPAHFVWGVNVGAVPKRI
jgi:hypothetical protein